MLRIARFSRRQLRRKLLLVLLSGLVPAISLLVMSFTFSHSSEYAAKSLNFGEQSISSTTPEVVRATNQLAENIRLSTASVADALRDLIERESNKALSQFKRNMPDAQQPAYGLRDAIELTLVESISNELRE